MCVFTFLCLCRLSLTLPLTPHTHTHTHTQTLQNFSIPKYFINDFFQRMPLDENSSGERTLGVPEQRHSPALFIGNRGCVRVCDCVSLSDLPLSLSHARTHAHRTRSPLHVDDLAAHFWMIQISLRQKEIHNLFVSFVDTHTLSLSLKTPPKKTLSLIS